MDNTHGVAEQVGILGAIATFLLGLFGIHRHGREKVEAKIAALDEKKADKVTVDRAHAEIRDGLKDNKKDHDRIYELLIDIEKRL